MRAAQRRHLLCALKLKRLYEPNAFNMAPNRTLQKAGFMYLKTHMTVPSALTYHQAVRFHALGHRTVVLRRLQ